VIGVNPDRRESDLEPISKDLQQLWSGNSGSPAAQNSSAFAENEKYQRVSLWWYVMLLALAAAIAEMAVASGYMGTQREEA
jgi:hypothetical protein